MFEQILSDENPFDASAHGTDLNPGSCHPDPLCSLQTCGSVDFAFLFRSSAGPLLPQVAWPFAVPTVWWTVVPAGEGLPVRPSGASWQLLCSLSTLSRRENV